MSHVSDFKRDSMLAIVGGSITNIDTLEHDYLVLAGATSGIHVNNQWMEVFLLNGATSANWNTAANQFLIALGAPGLNLADNWAWFWITNGGSMYLLRGTGASKTFESGTANYTETDGSIAATGSAYEVTAQATPTWADLGWVSNDLNAVASRVLIFTLNSPVIETTELIAGWTDNGLALADFMAAIKIDGAGNVDIYANGAASATAVSTVTNSTDEIFYIIKGGYNVNGVPMDAAANIADYPYGASMYHKHGAGVIKLIYRTNAVIDTGMDYPAMSFYDYSGDYGVESAVPVADLSALMIPIHLSTFTDDEDTALVDYTPEVGNSWSQVEGTIKVKSNRIEPTTSTNGTGSTEVSESDVFVDSILRLGSTVPGFAQAVARLSDGTHFWGAGINVNIDELILIERNGGDTKRASTSVDFSHSTNYRVRMAFDGTAIKVFWEDKTLSFTSSFNQSETKCGARLDDSDHGPGAMGQTSVYPIGNGGEYSVLGDY